ncbi:MAG: DNA-binding response regulator, partial [Flavobacteriales bacterium CG_4_10_14_0_8_um_filter_32_5]
MKAIIIDDERLARKELTSLLKEYSDIEIIAECDNAELALEKIDELKPDVLFLDIQMPGKNGFELLEELYAAPLVVFITAYDEYAIKAFEVNALSYLLKPIQTNKLEEVILKIRRELQNKTMIQPNGKLALEDRVFVKDNDKCWFIQLE